MTNQVFTSTSDNQTRDIARRISRVLQSGDLLGLQGELGAGKTTFVKGLAEGLGLKLGNSVSSPTYTFINEYACEINMLYHMDFYRLKSDLDADTLGIDQYIQGQGICAIEWFERASGVLPKDILEISFSWESENSRKISMIAHGPKSQAILSKIL